MLVISILILGTASFLSLPKVLYPKIKIPVVVVTTILPGANPSDVESLVTIPLEEKIKGLAGLKTYKSTSRESASIIYLEFETQIDPDKAKQDVQSAIDSLTTLPSDAQTPQVVKLDYENQPVWTFALTSKGDAGSLIRFAKILEDKIKNSSVVDKVETTGLEEQEIQVLIKPEALTTYQLNPTQIATAISAAINSFPAGTVNTDKATISLNINKAVNSVDDFRNLKISVGNTAVNLGDIAIISERSKPDQTRSFVAQPTDSKPQTAVTFSVYRNSNVTIDDSVKEVRKIVSDELANYPDQFSVVSKVDQSTKVDAQFERLMHDLSYTVMLIVVTLLIFLGAKQAAVASTSVPFSFLITFFVMKILDVSLSSVSFLALLLALGLLVDDTIVVISAMTAYHRTGKFSPMEVALLVWKDFLVAIITTTATTISAFLPLLISGGIIGEFIKPLPIVTSCALAASFIVAMFITMPFMTIILKPEIPTRVKQFVKFTVIILVSALFLIYFPKSRIFVFQVIALFVAIRLLAISKTPITNLIREFYVQRIKENKLFDKIKYYLTNGIISFEFLTEKYKAAISKVLESKKSRRKAVFSILALCLCSYLLVPLGLVKTEFFPKTNQDTIYINLELPEGTNSQTTLNEALKILPSLQKTPELNYVSLDLGKIYTTGVNFTGTGSNKAYFTLNLIPKEKRKATSETIGKNLRTLLGNYDQGSLSVVETVDGPPAGSDVEIKFFGSDLGQLDLLANAATDYLKKEPGVTNVSKSVKTGTSKITFVPDKAKVFQAGLDQNTVGMWLRLFASGYKADEIRLDDKTKDITVRFSSEIQTPEDISRLSIPAKTGYIPYISLGDLRLEPNPTLILREDGMRTISVNASVIKGFSVTDINKKLGEYTNKSINLPDGYTWQTGGVNEENAKSTKTVLEAMLIAVILITLTMIIQFESFRKALIVILVIPLSVAGVFILFAITRTSLSFPALIGVLALFGIVVKNSILVVDKITQNIKIGMPYDEAITDGASSRLEAIGLTSIAAILGLVPITISDPLWRGVGGAIIAGLSFSGIIILFFIPTVYYYFFASEQKSK